MSKRSQTVRSVLCALIAATLAASGAGASPPDKVGSGGTCETGYSAGDSTLGSASRLEKVIALRPSEESQVKRDFFVLVLEDGRRVVTNQARRLSSADPRATETSIEWTVDLLRGTYTAKETEPNERDRRFVARSKRRHPEARDLGASPDKSAANAGYYYLHAAETWEPGAYLGFAGLTRTEVELAWSECTNGRLYTDGFTPRCWANPYTFVATTWFNDQCQSSSPQPSAEWLLNGSVSGSYHNYDFWDDDEATYSKEKVTVEAHNGGWAMG